MKRACEATLEAEVKEVKDGEAVEDKQVKQVKRVKRGSSLPLYYWPGTPLAVPHARLTDDGTMPVVCVRARGKGHCNYLMDLFSRLPIKDVAGAYQQQIVPVDIRPIVKSVRTAHDQLAYRVQLSNLCEGNPDYTGARSLLVRFINGDAAVVPFYRIARTGADRLTRCNRPAEYEALLDTELLCMCASGHVPFEQ